MGECKGEVAWNAELLEVEGIYTRLEHTEDTLAELDEAVLR